MDVRGRTSTHSTHRARPLGRAVLGACAAGALAVGLVSPVTLASPRAEVAAAAGQAGVIAYQGEEWPRSRSGIFTVHSDGSHRLKIAPTGEQPRWSPDGSRLLFADITRRATGSTPDLVSVRPDGSDRQVLVRGGVYFGGAYSPDGSKVALIRTGSNSNHLMVLDLATHALSRVPETAAGFPDVVSWKGVDWSPDGTTLAFGGDTGEVYDDYSDVTAVFTVGVDGTGLRRLTGFGQVTGPRFSPDGTRILYATTYEGRGGSPDGITLRSVRTDGTDDRRVLARRDTGPGDWSPNGSHLVTGAWGVEAELAFWPFERAPLRGLWLAGSDGEASVPLVRGGRWPDWGPRSVAAATAPTVSTHHAGRPLVVNGTNTAGLGLERLEGDGDLAPLTSDGSSGAPQLSAEGTSLWFLRSGGHAASGWRMDSSGGGATRLVQRFPDSSHVAWDSRSSRVVLARESGLVLRDLVTGARSVVVAPFDGWSFDEVAWSDDGRWIAASARRGSPAGATAGHGILLVRPGGSGRHFAVTAGAHLSLEQPDLTPDAAWVAYTVRRGPDGAPNVRAVRRDGTRDHVVVATRGWDFSPAWSPSGHRLAVISDGPRPNGAQPKPGVWVVNRDGSNPELVLFRRGLVDLDW